MGITPEKTPGKVVIMNLELINKKELSRLLKSEIRSDRIPEKHKDKLQELSDLIDYWKRRNGLK